MVLRLFIVLEERKCLTDFHLWPPIIQAPGTQRADLQRTLVSVPITTVRHCKNDNKTSLLPPGPTVGFGLQPIYYLTNVSLHFGETQ